MAYDLSCRLVIGVASSALFDLSESGAFFHDHGESEYRQYQEERVDETFGRGVAFPFIRQLLKLNDLRPKDSLVEVIVLSRNDPETGLRVMNSIAAHELPISRAVFTRGNPPFPYMDALNMSLFLSGNEGDVHGAVERGLPAGLVLPCTVEDDPDDVELRVAFDFDAVLGDDSAERIYAEKGLEAYKAHEAEHAFDSIPPGPLEPFLAGLNRIQQVEEINRSEVTPPRPKLRIAVFTARDAPSHERAVRSLQSWGVTVDEAFFLGGIDKGPVLGVFRPHIFFDDQLGNLETSPVASVHIPYGIRNQSQP